MGDTDKELCGRIGGYTRWSRVTDRTAETAKARQAAFAKFEAEVDPDGVLDPQVREQRAQAARRAHLARMAQRSAQVRRERAEQRKRKAAAK